MLRASKTSSLHRVINTFTAFLKGQAELQVAALIWLIKQQLCNPVNR
jgi:hypothetical protein